MLRHARSSMGRPVGVAMLNAGLVTVVPARTSQIRTGRWRCPNVARRRRSERGECRHERDRPPGRDHHRHLLPGRLRGAAPTRPRAALPLGGGGRGGVANPLLQAELSPTPRTLYILWQEYQEGIGGRKPARLFTREERGKVKHKYCRRKLVWDRVSLLINAGHTAQVACDRIYDVYGQSATVTAIINGLKADTRNETLHDLLRV